MSGIRCSGAGGPYDQRRVARRLLARRVRAGVRVVRPLAGLTVALAGCQNPRGPVSLDSEDPDLHVLAVERAVADHDEADDPKLVRDLNDRDPAIRFYSIQGLRRLTGDDFGYHYYDDEATRLPAIERWRTWVAAHPVPPGR